MNAKPVYPATLNATVLYRAAQLQAGTTISRNLALRPNRIGVTFGPAALAAGVTITVPTGSTWTIV